MFAWLINHTILYIIVFFWGYFTLKLFYRGFFGIIGALFLGIFYYDLSSERSGFVMDVFYILGALDYKFYLREQASSYMSFAWQVGLDGVKENLEERIQLLKNKLNSQRSIGQDNTYQNFTDSNFDKNWYDEELERERQKAHQAEEKARKANEQARRAKEEAEREKRKQQNNQQKQHKQENQSSKKRLDPTNLKDAYEILGVEYGTDKDTCKLHFRKLMAMYHPDKIAGFTGSRKTQMEQEAKDIGVAWETIQKRK